MTVYVWSAEILLNGMMKRIPQGLLFPAVVRLRPSHVPRLRVDVFAFKLEAVAIGGWRPSLLGWRPLLLGWRPLLLGWRPSLLGWSPSLLGWRRPLLPWRPSLLASLRMLLGWRSLLLGCSLTLLGWRPLLLGRRPSLPGWRPSLLVRLRPSHVPELRVDVFAFLLNGAWRVCEPTINRRPKASPGPPPRQTPSRHPDRGELRRLRCVCRWGRA